MSVRMRHTKGQKGNVRSHHAIKAPRLSTCQDCGAFHLRHRICETCGKYKGNMIIDVAAKITKKNEKVKAKAKALGKDSSKEVKKEAEETKVVSAENKTKK
ncbi:50S ribosomal protein L32 [Candidatus Campbellbacteria bacterium RIFOXYC2_FULL_35_25]|uniref:Large ribosomal subunit protein bL32 n=1 Tax=Candidatus Campbellbacteria bacterium RIFOXYC2_FULL_35_25 TaxID=1797582 RepID=A0A1F5EJ58_9BACT|nr:MAG: 50S ribosomal protein L32 [Candidatus Campbellbacteria bacterium RIFOXYC2_FULL_35_25]